MVSLSRRNLNLFNVSPDIVVSFKAFHIGTVLLLKVNVYSFDCI